MLRGLCVAASRLRPEQLVHFLNAQSTLPMGSMAGGPQGPFLPYVRFGLWLPKQVTTNMWLHTTGMDYLPVLEAQHLTSECGQGLPLRPQEGSTCLLQLLGLQAPMVPPVSASVITWPLGVPVCFLYHLF